MKFLVIILALYYKQESRHRALVSGNFLNPQLFFPEKAFLQAHARKFDSESGFFLFKSALQSEKNKQIRNEFDNVRAGESGYIQIR